ncbi:hypothetical protein LCGC14_2090340, partial [marine sediment metagenome]
MKRIILILLLCCTVNATTYYIDFDNGDDGSDGQTTGEAWLTEGDAISETTSGDILRYIQADWADMNLPNWETLIGNGITTEAIELKQWAETWTISQYEQFGRFANGDFWIYTADPNITITGIDPNSAETAGRTKNGSMINPEPKDANPKHGYDSDASGYSASLNVGLDVVVGGNNLILATESSLVSSKTGESGSGATQTYLSDQSILTVVDTLPAVGDFRPAYCNLDKTSPFNKSALTSWVYDTVLQSLTDVASTPSQATVEAIVQRPHVDHVMTSVGGRVAPSNNYQHYGRNYVARIGDVGCWLHLNRTNAQKQTALISILQVGIDLYGITKRWQDENATIFYYCENGGHLQGRKWPIIFAGIVFEDAAMKAIDDIALFANDTQTFYVVSGDVKAFPYTKVTVTGTDFWGNANLLTSQKNEFLEFTATPHIGMPAWGEIHGNTSVSESTRLTRDGSTWGKDYQFCCTSYAWHGHVMAALMTDYGEPNWGKTIWDHNPIFDYMDRYFAKVTEGSWVKYSDFAYNMWSDNRSDFGAVWSGSYDVTAAATPTNDFALDANSRTTLTVSWTGAAANFDISADQTTAYAGVTSPYTITGLSAGTSYDLEVWGRKANGMRSLIPRTLTAVTVASGNLVAHYKMDDAAGQTVVA